MPAASLALGALNLSLLNAGVASSGGIGSGEGPSVGGLRPRSNNFTVEGVDNNSKYVTGHIIDIPNEAVQEFSSLQNTFSAEFGNGGGGQFNQVLRNGGNQFHGAAYEYLANRNLNAVDQAFARIGVLSNPRFDSNVFGGSIGGPILKNKLFFYGLYQYNPTGQATTPSPVEVAHRCRIHRSQRDLRPLPDQSRSPAKVPAGRAHLESVDHRERRVDSPGNPADRRPQLLQRNDLAGQHRLQHFRQGPIART